MGGCPMSSKLNERVDFINIEIRNWRAPPTCEWLYQNKTGIGFMVHIVGSGQLIYKRNLPRLYLQGCGYNSVKGHT